MAQDRFLIAPFKTGLKDDMKPWMIPEDAFAKLENAYIYEGRVRKRFGSSLMNTTIAESAAQTTSRLRIDLGNTDANGDITVIVPGWPFTVIGQMFSVGIQMFTVKELGVPGTLLKTGAATVATFDTTTGQLIINAGIADKLTACFFYPSLPVMGLSNLEETAINFETTIAFDTTYAYKYSASGWSRLGAAVWTGTNSDFFWTTNYRGATASDKLFFVTNFVAFDQMKYWDPDLSIWTSFNPAYNSTPDTIETARIIVGFKNRLLLFNTVESTAAGSKSFVNRLRYSQNGNPTQLDAFYESPKKGAFLDAPTKQQIVSAGFLKDRLIVFFERSTYQLVYTGNEVVPFRWQQINSELGVESTFSVIPFDKALLGIGNVGIHACNGMNVERIDQDIHHKVFEITNNTDGVVRVHGIRDYFVQIAYWSYPDTDHGSIYPTHVLTFNYESGSWGVNHDTFTAFGSHYRGSAATWETESGTWEEDGKSWNSPTFSSGFSNVIAGNQQGFVLVIEPSISRCAPALQITNISVSANVVTLKVISNNLRPNDFIAIENVTGTTGLTDIIYKIDSVTTDTVLVLAEGVAGTYSGGGTIARVSKIDILTKQYNFYNKEASNMMISKVDFLVNKTASGEFTVDSSPSFSQLSLLDEGNATGAILGNNILETSPYLAANTVGNIEAISDQLWHSMYFQSEGENVQLRMYFSEAQMLDSNIAWSDFEIDAMVFYVSKTGSRLQ